MSINSNRFRLSDFFDFLICLESLFKSYYINSIRPGYLILCDDIVDEFYLIPGFQVVIEFLKKIIFNLTDNLKRKNREISNYLSSSFSGFNWLVKLIFCLIIAPLLVSLIYSLFLIFSRIGEINFDLKRESVIEFFNEYFYAFSWYGSWLGVLYNVTAVLGVSFAVMTYYKNNQSQSSINHFSNVQLFREYVQAEISKANRLSPASFDLMAWYSCIYPQSKDGLLVCSEKYKSLMTKYNNLINSSNFSVREDGKDGFKYMHHQAQAKKLLIELGISVKETNRLGYHEVETEIISLIEKINAAFPTDANFKKFRKRSYL